MLHLKRTTFVFFGARLWKHRVTAVMTWALSFVRASISCPVSDSDSQIIPFPLSDSQILPDSDSGILPDSDSQILPDSDSYILPFPLSPSTLV